MTGFDTVVVVDWSAGNDRGARPKKDAIWAAIARDGTLEGAPHYLRNRDVALTWLTQVLDAELAAGRRVLACFDFPFGYPKGFAGRVTGSDDPLLLWDWYAQHLEDGPKGNNRFALAARINRMLPGVGPFWFNGEKGADHDGLPRLGRDRTHDQGLPERRLCETRAKGAFTCWQMGGAGAVGGQVMTGLAALSRLRATFEGKVSVWPFEALERPLVLAEIWPSLIDGAVRRDTGPDGIRDAVQVRVLARALSRMAVSRDIARLLADVPEAARREEGWILGLGHEADLERAAEMTDARQMKNDCFALPPGVDWTPVDDALAALRESVAPVTGVECLPVAISEGRVLAEAVLAVRSNPPGANAAVDGYGFAHASVDIGEVTLPLQVGRAAAGVPLDGEVLPGNAVRILTGALIPRGVDTVVLEEDTEEVDGAIRFENRLKRGANTRMAGEDVVAGDEVLRAGRRLTPADLALLTAVGVAEVPVRGRLRVGVLSTGDELADAKADVTPSVTFDANRPMLLSMARRWGFEAVDLGRAPDDRDKLREILDGAAERADVILTSGGASAGDEDHMSALLNAEGSVAHWRIALKPGRPLALGRWKGVPVFGLPGNPVAAFVCTLVFARPAMGVLAGGAWEVPQAFTVPAAFSKRKKPGRREYLRARLTEEGAAEVFASEGSGRISGLSWATGLVEIEDGGREIAPGDPVRFLPYGAFGL